MKKLTAILGVTILSLMTTGRAVLARGSDSAAAVTAVQAFYGWYYKVNGPHSARVVTDMTPVEKYFAPDLYALIARPCRDLDWNPFTAGNGGWQAYSIGSPRLMGNNVSVPIGIELLGGHAFSGHLTAIVKRDSAGRYVIDDFSYQNPPTTLRKELAHLKC